MIYEHLEVLSKCSCCNGTGTIEEKTYHNQYEYRPCYRCKSTGKVVLNIKINKMGILEEILAEIKLMKEHISQIDSKVNRHDPDQMITTNYIIKELGVTAAHFHNNLKPDMPFLFKIGSRYKARLGDYLAWKQTKKLTS
jgi:methylphosphotriester-DNA--protein-cysteine methyltransferase